jgi:hypothetical protein
MVEKVCLFTKLVAFAALLAFVVGWAVLSLLLRRRP